MVGLVPTIQAFAALIAFGVRDVDARHEGVHDEAFNCRVFTHSGFGPSGRPGMTAAAPLTRLVRDDQRE
jgi:hypothetical protein